MAELFVATPHRYAHITDAQFQAEPPEQLRKRLVIVFSYKVDMEHSRYTLRAATQTTITPYHGRVYLDAETGHILRLTMDADPPGNFPIQEPTTLVDYDYRKIAGTAYLLPVHAEVQALDSQTLSVRYRNVVEFRDYRKFSAESKLTFAQ